MKWIKAKDRTPDKEGEYYVKYNTGEKEVLYASGTAHHKRWLALVDEWLDESPSIQSGKGAEDFNRNIKQIEKTFLDIINKEISGEFLDGQTEAARKCAELLQSQNNREQQDKNFTVRLMATVEKHMKEAGVWEGDNKHQPFIQSLVDVTLEQLQGREPESYDQLRYRKMLEYANLKCGEKDEEIKLLNKTVENLHHAMSSAEQRGVAKATEEFAPILSQQDSRIKELEEENENLKFELWIIEDEWLLHSSREYYYKNWYDPHKWPADEALTKEELFEKFKKSIAQSSMKGD